MKFPLAEVIQKTKSFCLLALLALLAQQAKNGGFMKKVVPNWRSSADVRYSIPMPRDPLHTHTLTSLRLSPVLPEPVETRCQLSFYISDIGAVQYFEKCYDKGVLFGAFKW